MVNLKKKTSKTRDMLVDEYIKALEEEQEDEEEMEMQKGCRTTYGNDITRKIAGRMELK